MMMYLIVCHRTHPCIGLPRSGRNKISLCNSKPMRHLFKSTRYSISMPILAYSRPGGFVFHHTLFHTHLGMVAGEGGAVSGQNLADDVDHLVLGRRFARELGWKTPHLINIVRNSDLATRLLATVKYRRAQTVRRFL